MSEPIATKKHHDPAKHPAFQESAPATHQEPPTEHTAHTATAPPPTQQKPSVGRVVHFVLPDGPRKGEDRPADIVRLPDDKFGADSNIVNLLVKTDGRHDGTPYHNGVYHAERVHHSETREPGTWHWPQRV